MEHAVQQLLDRDIREGNRGKGHPAVSVQERCSPSAQPDPAPMRVLDLEVVDLRGLTAQGTGDGKLGIRIGGVRVGPVEPMGHRVAAGSDARLHRTEQLHPRAIAVDG